MKNSLSPRTAASDHLRRTEEYVRRIREIYDEATRSLARLAVSSRYVPGSGAFHFSDDKALARRAGSVLRDMVASLRVVVLRGTGGEWDRANKEIDEAVRGLLASVGVPHGTEVRAFGRWFNNHAEALRAFNARRRDGLALSERLWSIADAHMAETELAVSVAEGRSAAQTRLAIFRKMEDIPALTREYTDRLGRFRLPRGTPERNSYNAAMRLARTEINMAYRSAELTRYRDLDFVVGYEVRRSGRAYDCSVCQTLAGRYPKDFRFVGWHPNCRCFVLPVMNTDEEFRACTEAVLRGDDPPSGSVNAVRDVPKGFADWVRDNRERIASARKQPYFIRDNAAVVRELLAPTDGR